MKYKVSFFILLATALQCECGLSLLGGILSTAHEQVHEVAGAVLGTLNKGINLNFESHLGFNQQRPGYGQGPPQRPPNEFGPPFNNNYGPTNEFHRPPNNNYGQPNEFRPPHYNNNGPPNEFGPPNNNYGQRPHGQRPHQHGNQQPNFNNKPYGHNQNGYNPDYNNPNQNEVNINNQYSNENQRYPNNQNNNYQGNNYNNNNNGYNQGYPNQQNQDYNDNQNYPNNNGYSNNQNQPSYGNKPVYVNPNNEFRDPNGNNNVSPQDNLINGNKPVNGNPNNGFGTIYGEENQDLTPSSPQPEFSTSTISVTQTNKQTGDEKTTEKAKDDAPIFIPLGDYIYTGEAAANITAPKRETDKKPQEAEEEDFAIDIRFKD